MKQTAGVHTFQVIYNHTRLLVRYRCSLFWMEGLQLPWALKLQPPAYVCNVIGEEEITLPRSCVS